MIAREVDWFGDAPAIGERVEVQVRHHASAARAEVVRLDVAEIELALDEPVAAITPGQSLVLYRGDRVLGGGVIESARRRGELPVLAA